MSPYRSRNQKKNINVPRPLGHLCPLGLCLLSLIHLRLCRDHEVVVSLP